MKRLPIVIVVVVILGFLGVLFRGRFTKHFLTKYDEIDFQKLLQEDQRDPEWSKTFAPLNSPEGMAITGISPETPKEIEFLFKELLSFDSFSLYFYGNLHSVSSALAKDFEVYYLDQNQNWNLIDKVKKYSLPLYRFDGDKKIITKGIKIIVIKPAFTDDDHTGVGSVWYKDLRIYKKRRVGFREGVKYFVEKNKNTLPAYWVYYFAYLVLLFLPGFVFISLFERKNKLKIDPDLKFIFSPVFSIMLLFLGTILYLLTGIKLFLSFYLLVFIITLGIFYKLRLEKIFLSSKLTLIFMLIALGIFFLTISYRDYFYNVQHVGKYLDGLRPLPIDGYAGYFADNLFPWRIARVYLHRLPLENAETQRLLTGTTIFDRTPLLPMVVAGIMNVFGEGHFVFQRFMEVLGVLIYGAFFVLIKKYYSRKVAIVSLILVLTNVLISFTPLNAEYFYKYFSFYPILLAIILFITKNSSSRFLVGFLIGMSFLIHPATLFCIVPLIILYFFRDKKLSKFAKNILPMALVLMALGGFWLYSPKIFSPEKVAQKTKNLYTDLYVERFLELKDNLLVNKVIGFLYIFIPNVLLKGIDSEKISWLSREFRFEFFRYSLVSYLTPVIMILFFAYLVKNLKKKYEFIVLATGPLLLYWLLYMNGYNQAFNYGGFYFHLYTFTVPFFLASVVYQLLGKSKWFRGVVFSSYIAFMAYNLYSVSGIFITMKCASWIVKSLFWAIMGAYAILSLLLFRFGVFKTRE